MENIHFRRPASFTRPNYMFVLHGGGWCVSEASCGLKAPPLRYVGGFNSGNCSMNPLFCDFGYFDVTYCDYSSYESYRGVDGDSTFYGEQVLIAGLDTALTQMEIDLNNNGMSVADFKGLFLVVGGSAGSLGALLNAPYIITIVRARLPNALVRFVAHSSPFFELGTSEVEGHVPGDALARAHMSVFDYHGIETWPDTCSYATSGEAWRCWRMESALDNVPENTTWLLSYSALDEWSYSTLYLNSMVLCFSSDYTFAAPQFLEQELASGQCHSFCSNQQCEYGSDAENKANYETSMIGKASELASSRGTVLVHSAAPHVAEWFDASWSRLEVHPSTAQASDATSSIMRWHWMWAFGLSTDASTTLPCMTVRREFETANWTLEFPYNQTAVAELAMSISIPAARAQAMDALDASVCVV